MSAKKKRDFDLKAFLATIGEGRKFVFVPKKQTIFAQGDPSDAVFYIQNGKVKLTVVSNDGKELVVKLVRVLPGGLMRSVPREPFRNFVTGTC